MTRNLEHKIVGGAFIPVELVFDRFGGVEKTSRSSSSSSALSSVLSGMADELGGNAEVVYHGFQT